MNYTHDELDNIHYRMGVFLGFMLDNEVLQLQSLEYFQRVKDGNPTNPLPDILASAIESRRGNCRAASRKLSEAYAISPEYLRAGAARFFPEILEVYQGQAVFLKSKRKNWYTAATKIITFIKTKKAPQVEIPDFGSHGIQDTKCGMIWSEADQAFLDMTPQIFKLSKQINQNQSEQDRVDIMPGSGSNISLNQLTPIKPGVFKATGNDPYMVLSPPPVDLLNYPYLTMEASISDMQIKENWVDIYWAGKGATKFAEERKVTIKWPADGEKRLMSIPIGAYLPLLIDRPIIGLRIDFCAGECQLELVSLRLSRDTIESD